MGTTMSSKGDGKSTDDIIRELLEELPIEETDKKYIRCLLNKNDKFQKIEGLGTDIAAFISVGLKLKTKSFEIRDLLKIIPLAFGVMHKMIYAHPALNVLYSVAVGGMTIFNNKIDEPTVQAIMRDILQDFSDAELLKECEGLKFVLINSSNFLSGMGTRKLSDHEVSSVSAQVPFQEGLMTMGKLARRISELKSKLVENFCDRKHVEYEHFMRLIGAYCSLTTLKYGILFHYYFLLMISGNSPSLSNGVKAVIDSNFETNKNLLLFLVRPTSETAIIHHIDDIYTQEIPLKFLDVHGVKLPSDLSHLCEGVYILSCLAYKKAQMSIGNRMKQIKLDKEGRGSQNYFSFHAVSDKRGNYFQILSHLFPEYHLHDGVWTDFVKGEPSEGKGTWKFVPVYGEGEDSEMSVCYLIRPNGSKDTFLTAKSGGNIGVKKITAQLYDGKQQFWTITRVKT